MSASDQRKLRWVFFAAVAFGIASGIVLGIVTGSGYYGFHGGFLAAFVTGFVTKRALGVRAPAPQRVPSAHDMGFDPGEPVLHAGPANHFKGLEGVGGKLFLTDRRLRFRSHAFNVQTHDESYPLASIRSVEPSRTLGIVPNGLLVRLADGRTERFVVLRRSEWLSRLRAATAKPG